MERWPIGKVPLLPFQWIDGTLADRKGNGVAVPLVESTCSAIGEGRFGIEFDDSAGSHRLRHDAGLFGLATHDANRRVARFHVAGNPGGLGHLQPRDEDDVNRIALALDLDEAMVPWPPMTFESL